MKALTLYPLLLLLLAPLMIPVSATAQPKQKIDATNYYSFLSDGSGLKGSELSTDWIRKDEARTIILEEMKKAGIPNYWKDRLYRLNDTQIVLLDAFYFKPLIGFLFVEGHAGDPQKEHRDPAWWLREDSCLYTQEVFTETGQAYRSCIRAFPDHIVVLREDCYWFQYSNLAADNAKLVTRKDALAILRADVAAAIARIKAGR